MPLEKVGYRRLYDAIGCSIQAQDELRVSIPIGTTLAEIYLGPQPRFGIAYNQSSESKYVIPGGLSMMMLMDYQKDAAQSPYPRHFFVEIFCSKAFEVAQEISEAFHNKDSQANETLLQLASQQRDMFNQIADVIAGTIGLRFHRQFVLELINKNYIAVQNDNEEGMNFFGPSLEVLEDISLNPRGVEMLEKTLGGLSQTSEESLNFGAKALAWLMRGWAERDSITKFMDFFISLEVILSNITDAEAQKQQQKLANQISELINESDVENKSEILTFFKGMMERQRPSLNSRFEILAREGQLDGWTSDIHAFKRFNRIRNSMIHHGEKKVEMIVTVSEDEIRQIEDLAERYVSKVLFGDGLVYPSSWRSHVKVA